MHAGLVRLLDLIRVNPQDSLLVDRFLILAADLEENTRVDATLGLSEALLRRNPRRAIELAHMVYKARPGESQPLELMVEGLENLGRYGKATVLRAELEKVRNARDADPDSSPEITEASIMTIEKELKFLAGIDVSQPVPPPPEIPGASHKSVDRLPMLEAVSFEEPIKPVIKLPPPIPVESAKPMVHLADLGVPAPITASDINFNMNMNKELNSGSIPIPNSTPAAHLQRTSIAKVELQHSPNHAGNQLLDRAVQSEDDPFKPYAPPVRIESQVEAGVPMLREMVPNMDEDARERSTDEAPLSSGRRTSLSHKNQEFGRADFRQIEHQIVERVQMLIENHEWDEAWSLIDQQWPLADHPEMIRVFREMNLSRIDFRYMGWWLDALMFDRRPRHALILMIDLLREQPHMSLAKMLVPRIQKALRALGYREVQWKEFEGILALLRRLDLCKLQGAAATAILRPRSAS